MTDSQASLVRGRLKTPRAAAIAGILFSLLLISALWLLRLAIPTDPLAVTDWLKTGSARVSLALNLVPFAGIAFLWFIGVLRDRLGEQEDRFFATAFLGSGLLFLDLTCVAAAVGGGLILAYSASPEVAVNSAAFGFARALSWEIMHVYAFRMAAVFMVSTAMLGLHTRFIARWNAVLGLLAAVFLLVGSSYVDWALFVFPLWVLLVSVSILQSNLLRKRSDLPA